MGPIKIFASLLLIFSLPEVLAQQPSSTPATAEEPQAAAEIQLGTPTPKPNLNPDHEDDVEPLDAWEPAKTTPTPALQEGTAVGKTAEADSDFPAADSVGDEEVEESEPAVELESVESDAQLPEDAANKAALDAAQKPRHIQLSKNQKKRMQAARSTRWKLLREQRKNLGISLDRADIRGEPEIRLCTLNLNYYGTVENYRRVFKSSKLRFRRKIERSTVSAIKSSACDVVALQNILGGDNDTFEKAVNALTKILKRDTGSAWSSYLSLPNRDIVRNGFIVRKGAGEVVHTESFGTVKLTTFGTFQAKEFARAPFELILKVTGKEKADERILVLLTYDFRNSFIAADKEPESLRMQMADAIRQIIHTEAHKYPPEVLAMLILLGDRRGPQFAPATQLLEGRSRLADFTQNGGCALTEDNKVQCKENVVHFKEFFGLNGENLEVIPTMHTTTVDGVRKQVLRYPDAKTERHIRRKLRENTSEIYLQSSELDYARVKQNQAGRYRAGEAPVQSGLKQSSLIWAELNW